MADMEQGKIVAICQYGGEFSSSDGSLTYTGGEAHIVDIDHGMLFDDFKSEIANLFGIDIGTVSIKYFLPNNKKTLITVSSDKDLKRMINFHASSDTTDVYLLKKANTRDTGIVVSSGTSTISVGRNVRQRKQSSVGKSGNRAAGTRTNAADGAHGADVGVTAENGRKQQRTTVERVNSGSTGGDFSTAVITTPTPVSVRQQTLIANDYDYNREIGTIDSELGVSGTENLVPYSANPYDDALYVGQEFDNVKVFRDELCKYAFLKGFKYKFIKNEHARLTAKCSEENCPWRVHASESSRKKTFVVKKINNAHTCKLGCSKDRRATPQWLASIIKDKLRESPHLRPKDIVADLFDDYGISLNYHQAWRGKELAQKELFTLHEEACNQLPWFCERIIETNPGSVAMLAATADSKFRRVFVSFHASLHGFEHGCRPLLFLDKIPLKTNLQWKLLAAATVDADDGIFPVAFAAVEAETYDSWLWFLVQLKYAVTTMSRAITFVTHRQKGLEEVLSQVFEGSFHSFCLNQLMEDFQMELKKGMWSEKIKDTMMDYFKNAAYACNIEDFNVHIDGIRNVSKDVADWVIGSKPEHWSNAVFKGQRYDHYSPQAVKSFSSWIPVKHESSVVRIIDAIRDKMMEVMHARRETSKTWEGILTPTMEEKLKKEIPRAAHYVVCSSDTVFEVRWNTVNVVNIGTWECTCRRWQMTGLPCTHALTVFDRLAKNMYDYCSRYFTTEMYRVTYSESIHPIPEVERIDSIFKNSYPPRTNRPPDRPKRKRINPNKSTIRPLRCSRCKAVGHNKATCEAFL